MKSVRMGRTEWLIAAVVGVVVLLVASGWVWTGSHAVLPGLEGCELIRSSKARTACTGDFVLRAASDGKLREGLIAVDQQKRSPQRLSECHQAMHSVGRTIARRTVVKGDDIVSGSSAQACSSGIAHGALEQTVQDNPTGVADIAEGVCLGTRTNRDADQCFHGIGHGLKRGDAAAAGQACDRLRPIAGTADCLGGYFMEISIRGKAGRVQEALETCRVPNEATKLVCFTYFPYAGIEAGLDWTLPMYTRFCSEHAPAGPAQWGCVHRASNAARTVSDMRGCTALDSGVATQVCAASIAAELAPQNTAAQGWERICARAGEVSFGCGVGAGRRYRWEATPRSDAADAAARCSALPSGDVQDGCRMGARGCWFPERVNDVKKACRSLSLPQPLRREIAAHWSV